MAGNSRDEQQQETIGVFRTERQWEGAVTPGWPGCRDRATRVKNP